MNDITKENKLRNWGPGEWVDEPDFFSFEHAGFHCFICRTMVWDGLDNDHLFGGNLCGYVDILEGHPWYGKDVFDSGTFPDVEVHGGLTYGEVVEEKKYRIGFDCAHSYDIIPSMIKIKKQIMEGMIKDAKDVKGIDISNSTIFRERYRNFNYVMQQTKSLAEQAKKAQDEE